MSDLQAENVERLRNAIEVVLSLTSSYEADRGNHVLLVGNLQAREILKRALDGGK